jgi:predicted RNA-binding Zn-ribbon protein involved in translation (DUF1610 family)
MTNAAEVPTAEIPNDAPKIKMVCEHCGSDDVGRDANARWDERLQDWVLSGVHDTFWCNACGADDIHVAEVKVT